MPAERGSIPALLSFRIAAIARRSRKAASCSRAPCGTNTLIDAKRAGEIEASSRTALCEGKTTFLNVLAENEVSLALDALVAYCALDHPGGHAETLRHLVLSCRGAAGAGWCA